MMNLQEHIKKVLRESVSPQVRRRHGEFDKIFKHYRESFINNPYKSFNSLWNTLLEVTMETLYHAWFSKTVSDDDWEESAEYIEKYLIKKYKEETKQMWNDRDSINESDESKQERKFTKLLTNIEEFLNSNEYPSVVRLTVDYDEVMDDVIVNIFIDPEHAVKLGGGINSVIKKSGKKIMEDLSALPFDFKYHIHFEKPKLNESEHKKSSLLKAIEEDGLLHFIKMTGLSLPQIYTKTGELPREVFERFIKDFINKEGYHQSNGAVQLGYEVEIQTHVHVDHFYLEGDRVTLEIKGYNNHGEQTDGYIESMSNLTDEEVFGIVEDMILWGGNGYY